jgi:hypothetical protein
MVKIPFAEGVPIFHKIRAAGKQDFSPICSPGTHPAARVQKIPVSKQTEKPARKRFWGKEA